MQEVLKAGVFLNSCLMMRQVLKYAAGLEYAASF